MLWTIIRIMSIIVFILFPFSQSLLLLCALMQINKLLKCLIWLSFFMIMSILSIIVMLIFVFCIWMSVPSLRLDKGCKWRTRKKRRDDFKRQQGCQKWIWKCNLIFVLVFYFLPRHWSVIIIEIGYLVCLLVRHSKLS